MTSNPESKPPNEASPHRDFHRLLAVLAVIFVIAAILVGIGAIAVRVAKPGSNRPRPDIAKKTTPPKQSIKTRAPKPTTYRPDPVLAREGEQLYNAFCASCHQPGATGLVGLAPSIRNRDFLALAGDEFVRNTIRMGRPGTAMVPWSHLSDGQIDGILAYLHTARDYHPVDYQVDHTKKHTGDAVRGKTTYQTYCASCHGPEGAGYAAGGSGPGIGLAGFLAVASDDYIFKTVKHGRIGTAMRSFIGPAGLANLSEEQVGDVIAYLRSIEPTTEVALPGSGHELFDINCAACHQPGGAGKPGFAPSIRNADFLAIASDDFIRQTVRSGRPSMAVPGRPDLSDDAIDKIIDYLRSVPGAAKKSIKVDPTKQYAGNTSAGHTKYATYCAACHGPEGTGYAAGGTGPAIGLGGFLSTASDDYIFQTVKHGRVGTAMRPFIGPTGLANLSPGDVSDIISYLRTLN